MFYRSPIMFHHGSIMFYLCLNKDFKEMHQIRLLVHLLSSIHTETNLRAGANPWNFNWNSEKTRKANESEFRMQQDADKLQDQLRIGALNHLVSTSQVHMLWHTDLFQLKTRCFG